MRKDGWRRKCGEQCTLHLFRPSLNHNMIQSPERHLVSFLRPAVRPVSFCRSSPLNSTVLHLSSDYSICPGTTTKRWRRKRRRRRGLVVLNCTNFHLAASKEAAASAAQSGPASAGAMAGLPWLLLPPPHPLSFSLAAGHCSD